MWADEKERRGSWCGVALCHPLRGARETSPHRGPFRRVPAVPKVPEHTLRSPMGVRGSLTQWLRVNTALPTPEPGTGGHFYLQKRQALHCPEGTTASIMCPSRRGRGQR